MNTNRYFFKENKIIAQYISHQKQSIVTVEDIHYVFAVSSVNAKIFVSEEKYIPMNSMSFNLNWQKVQNNLQR